MGCNWNTYHLGKSRPRRFNYKRGACGKTVEFCASTVEACIILYDSDYDVEDMVYFTTKTSLKTMETTAEYKGWTLKLSKGTKPLKVAPVIGLAIDIADYAYTKSTYDEPTDKIDRVLKKEQELADDINFGVNIAVTVCLAMAPQTLGLSLVAAVFVYIIGNALPQMITAVKSYDKDTQAGVNIYQAYMEAMSSMNNVLENWDFSSERSIPFGVPPDIDL